MKLVRRCLSSGLFFIFAPAGTTTVGRRHDGRPVIILRLALNKGHRLVPLAVPESQSPVGQAGLFFCVQRGTPISANAEDEGAARIGGARSQGEDAELTG